MEFVVPDTDGLIAAALAEDLGVATDEIVSGRAGPELLARDVTVHAVVPSDAHFTGVVRARQGGVVAGLPVLERVFSVLETAVGEGFKRRSVEVFPLVAEGAEIDTGTVVAEVEGDAGLVLTAERTALNFLMMLSGIATVAAAWQKAAGPDLHVVDTRKTLPGLRVLSKYAVRVGGAYNHRIGLYDMALIKDNHIARAGGIIQAVQAARATAPELKIEVEADTIEQALQAARAGADMVLLDNMDDATLTRAVAALAEVARASGHDVVTEASGNIVFERLATLRQTGVDRVSSSALTLAPPLDFGLDEVNP